VPLYSSGFAPVAVWLSLTLMVACTRAACSRPVDIPAVVNRIAAKLRGLEGKVSELCQRLALCEGKLQAKPDGFFSLADVRTVAVGTDEPKGCLRFFIGDGGVLTGPAGQAVQAAVQAGPAGQAAAGEVQAGTAAALGEAGCLPWGETGSCSAVAVAAAAASKAGCNSARRWPLRRGGRRSGKQSQATTPSTEAPPPSSSCDTMHSEVVSDDGESQGEEGEAYIAAVDWVPPFAATVPPAAARPAWCGLPPPPPVDHDQVASFTVGIQEASSILASVGASSIGEGASDAEANTLDCGSCSAPGPCDELIAAVRLAGCRLLQLKAPVDLQQFEDLLQSARCIPADKSSAMNSLLRDVLAGIQGLEVFFSKGEDP